MIIPDWLATLLALFDDRDLDEVVVNSAVNLLATRWSGSTPLPSPFVQPHVMGLALQELALAAGVRLDHLCPTAGGILADCSFRWQGMLPPAAASGPLFVLRRHRFAEIQVTDFGMNDQQQQVLQELMNQRKALVIAGPTGCGKTTILAALLQLYANTERVVVIEELAELPLRAPGWIRLLGKEANIDGRGQLTVARLLKDSLRLRPDRLVLGELQRGQVGAFFESIWAGHGGSLATVHGASVAAVEQRLLSVWAQELGEQAQALLVATRELDLWCVVMERGKPPLIREIRRLWH